MTTKTPNKTLIRLKVNGQDYQVAAAVSKTLLEVLREDLNLPGTKHGCEVGECGTCCVLIDGQPVLSPTSLPARTQVNPAYSLKDVSQPES